MPMPITDSMFLIAETRDAPMHVGSLQLYDPAPGMDSPEALRALYERMLAHTEVAPVFGRRARRDLATGGQWAWERDDVDLEYHVRRSALPSPGRPRELMELVGRLHSTLLDRRRPLWETHLIEGLDDGRFAIYTKIHHACADGITGLHLTEGALSLDPDARDLPAPWSPQAEAPDGPGPSLLSSARSLVGGTVGSARDLIGMGPAVAKQVYKGLAEQTSMLPFQAPRTILNATISGSRRFVGQSWSLQRVKAIGASYGATGNDVVLALTAGALRRYLTDLDALPDKPLVAMVPVGLATGKGAGSGNAVGTLLCNLGTDQADAADRIATVKASMDGGKAGLAGLSALQISLISAGMMLPAQLGSMTRAHDVARPAYNLVVSNVPGGRKPLYYNGSRLAGMYPLSIPQQGNALNVTVLTRDGQVAFGLIGCRRTLPHLQRMIAHIDAEFDALEAAAG